MKRVLYCIFCLCFMHTLFGQEAKYVNPILPGSYPDPSICKVGDTFYLVNSTFEYFPGLPVHSSKDLVNWDLVGYGLHREEQCKGAVNLVDVQSNGGIHAPTIRFHKGRFYIITTNVYYHAETEETDFVNFIIHAESPAGPWSDPIVVEGAPGIDPDIFFDDDGKVWYAGTRMPDDPSFNGEGQIWMQELDPVSFQLIGEEHLLWRGACGGVWAEGPHIYKNDGRYYLLIAEGGTSFNHAVMIAVSDSITGPYVPNDRNPIITARHLSYDHWVHSVGHADIIEVEPGEWYMLALGVRGDIERGSNMGRETHLFPVTWEREPFEWKEKKYLWPVVSAESGRPDQSYELPYGVPQNLSSTTFSDDFSSEKLSLDWNYRRVPREENFQVDQRKECLRIFGSAQGPQERERSSWLGIRQTESDFSFSFKMEIDSKSTSFKAGLGFVQKDDNYLLWDLCANDKGLYLEAVLKEPSKDPLFVKSSDIDWSGSEIWMKLESRNDVYTLSYSADGINYIFWDKLPANTLISKGYTGAYLGLHVIGIGSHTDFDDVLYEPYSKE
ncbi:MAG: glycoside hydrolase family 43 protein [Saprospiraceae bacterium]|nr:glycoside hydrolase family 43 protein [Saprospiraceae bacterium]